jgi:hypothetical protein
MADNPGNKERIERIKDNLHGQEFAENYLRRSQPSIVRKVGEKSTVNSSAESKRMDRPNSEIAKTQSRQAAKKEEEPKKADGTGVIRMCSVTTDASFAAWRLCAFAI